MARTDGDFKGLRSMSNPLWCYHGYRTAVLALSVFGVIMVFSSSAASSASEGRSPFTATISQTIVCVVGLAVGMALSAVPVDVYRRKSFLVVILAIVGQSLTFTPLGIGQYGNQGWIQIPGTSQTFQPAELTKFALCMWMPSALVVARRRLRDAKGFKAVLQSIWAAYKAVFIVYGLCLALVIGGKDLGTAMIVMLIGFVGLLVSGFPLGALGVISGVGVACVVALVASSPNRRERVLAAYMQCSAADAQERPCDREPS